MTSDQRTGERRRGTKPHCNRADGSLLHIHQEGSSWALPWRCPRRAGTSWPAGQSCRLHIQPGAFRTSPLKSCIRTCRDHAGVAIVSFHLPKSLDRWSLSPRWLSECSPNKEKRHPHSYTYKCTHMRAHTQGHTCTHKLWEKSRMIISCNHHKYYWYVRDGNSLIDVTKSKVNCYYFNSLCAVCNPLFPQSAEGTLSEQEEKYSY